MEIKCLKCGLPALYRSEEGDFCRDCFPASNGIPVEAWVVECRCEICGEEIEVDNYANLTAEELCPGIICDMCAAKYPEED